MLIPLAIFPRFARGGKSYPLLSASSGNKGGETMSDMQSMLDCESSAYK